MSEKIFFDAQLQLKSCENRISASRVSFNTCECAL